MDWFKVYRATSTDPRWLLVRRMSGADGAQVLGVWLAMNDHASAAKPRGSLADFSIPAFAAALGIAEDLLQRVFVALGPDGICMHDGVAIREWDEQQSVKFDRTNRERQARFKARQRAKKSGEKHPETLGNAVTGVSDNCQKNPVTPGNDHRRDRSEASVSSNASIPVQPSIASSSTRAARAMKVGEVWTELEQLGLPVASLRRMFHTAQIRQWVEGGITPADLAEAIQRARAARQRANDPSPLNVGFLSRFVADVLGGHPATATRSKGHGAVDAAADAFLAGR